MLSKKEFEDIAVFDENGIGVTFPMPVDFSELVHNCSGIEMLNDMIADFVEDGCKLEGMSYTPIATENNDIIVSVWANCEEWKKDNIKSSYEDGNCPDCQEPIPDDMSEGGACSNCGHVFWFEKDDD